MKKIGVVGAGTMGRGIVQLAAQNGHEVWVCDNEQALNNAEKSLIKTFSNLVEKGKISSEDASDALSRINFNENLSAMKNCSLVIEAIVENLEIKKEVFAGLEQYVFPETILASNTSSLSIASIAGALKNPERFIGIHFFNPVPLMPLVEIVPSFITDQNIINKAKGLIDSWGKTTVMAKDTPGFIVNRIARPYYGEAMRIYEEGIADIATIDWAMKEIGGFKMGPFELTDFIGHDVNYTVTETVFTQFYFDPRFKPALCQKRLLEAGFLGRKTGRGFYDYRSDAIKPEPTKDTDLGKKICDRIIAMLINEAFDALLMNVASKEDIEISMTKGVNYPKGLFAWAEEIGHKNVLARLEALQADYGEDRYRPNFLLRKMSI